MGVALVCIAIIIALIAGYVVKSTGGDKYGPRLDGISDVLIEDDKKSEMESKLLEQGKVQDAKINIHGKIVNFNIDLEEKTTVQEAQNIAIGCLDFFEEDYLNFYDIEFIMTKKTSEESSKNFPMFGYRKAQAATISWSNNIKKK